MAITGAFAAHRYTLTIIGTTANNYYVATTGSDSSSGTQAAPLRTTKKAASVVEPDYSTVHVPLGTYDEAITTTVSGTASGRIRYVPNTKYGAKIVHALTAKFM